MDTVGPSEFARITGLSAKAVRLYEERGLLAPASIDGSSGFRRYTNAEVTRAGRIALLRRAGIPLTEIGGFLADPQPSTIDRWLSVADAERNGRRNALRALAAAMGLEPSTTEEDVMAITIRGVESHEELGAAFDLAGSQFDPPIDRSDNHRLGDLRAALERGENDLLLLAEDDDGVVGAALGFKGDPTATLRILAVTAEHRGRGVGRSLLRAFERAAARAGLESIALGADEAAGFYVRHGYQTVLLLQWVYDASLFERERDIVLAAEILQHVASRESACNGIPQLFVVLGEPTPTVRGQVADLVTGAHVGYCMIKTVDELQAAGV